MLTYMYLPVDKSVDIESSMRAKSRRVPATAADNYSVELRSLFTTLGFQGGVTTEDFASGMMGSPGGGGFAGGSMSGGDLLQVLQRLGGVGIAAQASPAQ